MFTLSPLNNVSIAIKRMDCKNSIILIDDNVTKYIFLIDKSVLCINKVINDQKVLMIKEVININGQIIIKIIINVLNHLLNPYQLLIIQREDVKKELKISIQKILTNRIFF
ncbi:hypothetical protein, partial [Bacillus cereus]|uniref:hypothetical protein n=1 Tax=Bacillus cereus TaxID=1396 RepID=UPI0019D66D23